MKVLSRKMWKRRKVYRFPGRQSHSFARLNLNTFYVVGFFIAVLGFGSWQLLHKPSSSVSAQPAIPEVIDQSQLMPTIKSAEARYMFSGTVVLDRIVSADAKTATGYNYEEPFSHMADFGSYDAAVADLECPVTNNDVGAAGQIGVDNPKFNCRPEWLPTLKKYFPIINLSSNHTYDRGPDGFSETVKNLKTAGFQVIGNYSPHADPDNNCKVLTMPVRLDKNDGQTDAASLPIGFCSFNYKQLFSPAAGELEQIQKFKEIMPVFGMLNSGQEYLATAGDTQRSLAHTMIDYGAEFVIANGTHWVQNSESYKGKLITYSLGNFIFDQSDDESRRSANIFVNLKIDYNKNLADWLSLGQKCQAETDNCLNLIEAQHLKKPELKLSFDMIAAEGGLRAVTHKADSATQKAVEDRLNWSQTISGLNMP